MSDFKVSKKTLELAKLIEPNLNWDKEYWPHEKRWHAQWRAIGAAGRIIQAGWDA